MADRRPDGLQCHAFPFDCSICEIPTFVRHTGIEHETLRSSRHYDTDIALDPLSTNRRFQPFTQLAGLGTMVVTGTTPESIRVLIPDYTEPPVGDNVTVDLRHVVEFIMGNPFDMGSGTAPTDLAGAMCPN